MYFMTNYSDEEIGTKESMFPGRKLWTFILVTILFCFYGTKRGVIVIHLLRGRASYVFWFNPSKGMQEASF